MNVRLGERVLVEQAWEDETGQYHDEYAVITNIGDDDLLTLNFDEPKVNEFLAGAEYHPNDIQLVEA